MKKVILSADSTCDLGPILKERYNVEFFPFTITLDDKTYLEYSNDELYKMLIELDEKAYIIDKNNRKRRK